MTLRNKPEELNGLCRLHSSWLPLVVGGGQRGARGRLVADLVLLLQHAVGEGDEVALQDEQALPQALGRQGALGHQP